VLHADEPAEVIMQRLLEQRGPLYEETADYIIDTANNSIQNIIQAIIKPLKSLQKRKNDHIDC
jgi:shikimate kinase